MVGVGQIPEAGYASSKGGLANLTRELAAQWARKGVRVNCLAPGWFRTEMTDGLTINEAAETTGWSPRMLRYLERVGLIEPNRTDSGMGSSCPTSRLSMKRSWLKW